MLFSQNNLIIPLCSVGAKVSASPAMESFHMKGYDHATLIFMWSGCSASRSIHINCASSDGGDTVNMMAHYRTSDVGVGNTSADILGSIASASTVPVASGDKSNMTIIELDAGDLPATSRTYEWVTASLSGGATGDMSAVAILSKPRYADNVMNTAIV